MVWCVQGGSASDLVGEPKGIAKSRSGDARELCQPSAELVGAFMLGGFALA